MEKIGKMIDGRFVLAMIGGIVLAIVLTILFRYL